MSETALHRALHDHDEYVVRLLPSRAVELLTALRAPPRLAAHLRVVHDVAAQLLDWLDERYPMLLVDHTAVRFGAAIHDIGKVAHPAELSGPGQAHEAAGYRILVAHGVPERLARFARSHGDWDAADTSLEELLVSLADKIWKGRREPALEQRVVDRLVAGNGQQPWETFMALDDVLSGIAGYAEQRLAFTARYGVAPRNARRQRPAH